MPEKQIQIFGYDAKLNKIGVPILNGVITKTSKNTFMVTGISEEGNKLTTLINGEKALAAIRAGIARFGGS